MQSRNVPAVYLMNQLKQPGLYDLLINAEISQLKPRSHYGLSLALGGAEISMQELATLYAMLVNNGNWQPLNYLQHSEENRRKTLLSPEAAFLVLSMLKETPPPFKQRFAPLAFKTGTSSGYRDAWTAGVAGPYVLVLWLGNFDQEANHAFIGKDLAAPLFFDLMEALSQNRQDFSENQTIKKLNLIQVEICKASGLLPTRYCPEHSKSWFIPGKSPILSDTVFRETAIDPDSGLRTCQINPKTQFSVFEFWPSDILQIFKQAGIKRKSPPPYEKNCMTVNTNSQSPQITSPADSLTYIIKPNAKNTRIPLTAVTDGDVKKVFWFANNQLLGISHLNKPFLWKAQPGRYTVRVVDDHGMADKIKVEIALELKRP